jgi:hypothetical protein
MRFGSIHGVLDNGFGGGAAVQPRPWINIGSFLASLIITVVVVIVGLDTQQSKKKGGLPKRH